MVITIIAIVLLLLFLPIMVNLGSKWLFVACAPGVLVLYATRLVETSYAVEILAGVWLIAGLIGVWWLITEYIVPPLAKLGKFLISIIMHLYNSVKNLI